MVILNNISESEAIRAFASYCSQNSTPADIFNFDGKVPEARLKFDAVVAYFSDYNYSALIEITTESNVTSKSSLGNNTTEYRNNLENSDRGFFSRMYEDFSDTRYTESKIENRFMDRISGNGFFVVLGSTGQIGTVDEKLWPSANLDTDLLLEEADYRVQGNLHIKEAVNLRLYYINIDNAEPPYKQMEYVIEQQIHNDLKDKYSNCHYEVKHIDYQLAEDEISFKVILFPYYEFTFFYNSIPYKVQVAAHNQAEASTGFFGGSKDVVIGQLPSFEKMPGSIFSKIKERKNRNDEKKRDKENFLNTTAKNIVFLP